MTATAIGPSPSETLDSEDAAEVFDFLDAAYGNSLRLEQEPGRVTFRRTDLGLVSVDDLVIGSRVAFDTDSISRLNVMECRAGIGRYHRAGLSDDVTPGDVVATAAPGDSYAGYCGPVHLRVLNLDLEALSLAGTDAQGDRSPLRFDGLRTAAGRDAVLWARMVDFVEASADRGRAGGLAERELARLVARTVLEVFPNSSWTEPSGSALGRDGRDASATAVRRAKAHIDSVADQDVALADIAAAAHVSTRALQVAFQRHLGTTPMRYLQGVRLQLARRALLDADHRTTVAVVASRWGFYNHGRFAATYREEFGELPSETLNRVLGAGQLREA